MRVPIHNSLQAKTMTENSPDTRKKSFTRSRSDASAGIVSVFKSIKTAFKPVEGSGDISIILHF